MTCSDEVNLDRLPLFNDGGGGRGGRGLNSSLPMRELIFGGLYSSFMTRLFGITEHFTNF